MADWDKISSRGDVEDRRSYGPALGGLGLVGIIITLAFSFLSGAPVDVGSLLNQIEQSGIASQTPLSNQDFDHAEDFDKFSATVLGSTNDYWNTQFSQNGRTYAEPTLVLFRTATRSGCGLATSDVGPHYCPADQTIYLDETFFSELQRRFKAKGGDVAEAYVIAHEVGHHVQDELGLFDNIGSQESNTTSVKVELQADCYAGAWANSVAHLGVFEPGEVNEAIDAAAAVGDDRIQARVNGQINPETWTHGSSEERVHWFETGFNSGQPSACNTFG